MGDLGGGGVWKKVFSGVEKGKKKAGSKQRKTLRWKFWRTWGRAERGGNGRKMAQRDGRICRKMHSKGASFAAERTGTCIQYVCAWFFYAHNNLILLISPFYYKPQHKSVTSCWTTAVQPAKDWGSEMENNNSVWRRDGRGEGEEGGARGEDICKSLQESARTNAVLPCDTYTGGRRANKLMWIPAIH